MRFVLSNVKGFLCDKAGFSLLELSVVLAIIGIVAASGLSLMGARLDAAQEKVTKDHQAFLLKSLANHLLSYGKLPCPSTDFQGIPKESCKSPRQSVGYVPFDVLGLSSKMAQDGWGRVMRYAVHPQMTDLLDAVEEKPMKGACLLKERAITVYTSQRATSSSVEDPVVVVIYSQGAVTGALSESERVNDADDLTFVEKDLVTHKDHPHRHLLVSVTRNNLLSHYAGFSCPGYLLELDILKEKTAPVHAERLPSSPFGETSEFSW